MIIYKVFIQGGTVEKEEMSSVIVVGTGLAGLTATLGLLQKGISVTLLEKTTKFGGNSIKASSGINGVPTRFQDLSAHDSIELFIQDTLKSGKGLSNLKLVETLAENSKAAIDWLSDDGVDLSLVTQLGGHSHPRTHRGSGKLPPGFAIISALSKKIESMEHTNKLTILKNSNFQKLLTDNGKVTGVEYISLNDMSSNILKGSNVVLATGGFSADLSLKSSLISKHRPDLLNYPLTNGVQTTGDSQKIAERDVNANLIHMDQVQIHPTGFIKLAEPDTKWKFLCGELIRGIGGVLISPNTGDRFVDELQTRDQVSQAIEKNCQIAETNTLNLSSTQKVAIIVVNQKDYLTAQNHINFYLSQGLLFKSTRAELSRIIENLNPDLTDIESKLSNTFEKYNNVIKEGKDSLGRSIFGSQFEDDEILYYGLVTPVLHFTMGGIEINENANVISKDGKLVPNLYAIGEVSGGVHGGNRLGGSSLLECVVYGRVVAEEISKQSK